MIERLDDYQAEAIKTLRPMELRDINQYCTIKLCEEIGEVASLISKSHFHGKEFNKEDLKLELSDLLWYIANMAKANGFSLSEVATANIEKLRKRHGETYNQSYYTP